MSINLYVCMCVTVWTGICVGYMCIRRTAAFIDIYEKGRGPFGHSSKGYGFIESQIA